MMDLSSVIWPDLNEHYLKALKAGTKWIIDNFDPQGIIVCGTIIRGNPDASSDFDVFVIHNKPFRQRIQRIFNSVPFEIFVNPPTSIKKNMGEEFESAMQCTSDMLATGYVLINNSEIIVELINEAKSYLNKEPGYDAKRAEIIRYKAAVLLEDAIDIKDKDIANANIFISDTVQAILDWFYYEKRVFVPRKKEIITKAEMIDSETGKYCRKVMETNLLEDKIYYLKKLADLTIKTYGFFEWESEREVVEMDGDK